MDQRSIEDTLITQRLDERPPRSSEPNREIEAYCKLAEEVVEFADDVLKEIAPLALGLCHAGSAGISLLETDPEGKPLIRWEAVAGALEPRQGVTIPQEDSPCGLAAAQRAPLLFDRPERAFPVFRE